MALMFGLYLALCKTKKIRLFHREIFGPAFQIVYNFCMRKIKSPYRDDESNFKLMLKRYQDIENGIVMPPFEEFFKLCILFELAENVNLKELFPGYYKMFKKEVEDRKRELGR